MNSFHECQKCGRPLKDEKSKERGYGLKCWKKLNAELDINDREVVEAGIPAEMKAE
ncbi:DUF6011 domain-containing protein [Salicibibacter kimchii]|uniref:DUF6011 domain-containing protein n=1 Tax=Salicibibacter kimchii TaxID=2099786 RepID=UPI001357C5A1|nr:DUF6011 domain-containing protein [Salicibibacter kimchii]